MIALGMPQVTVRSRERPAGVRVSPTVREDFEPWRFDALPSEHAY